MESNFKYNLGILKVDQLGFVYKDIKKQARLLESKFNLPQFIFTEEKSHSFKYRGEESEVILNVGISRMGNTQIELIQLIEGECLHKEFLDQGKEGFQHIGTYVDNVQQAVEEFRRIEIEPVQTGTAVHHFFAYMDIKKYFGTYIELLELVKRKRRR